MGTALPASSRKATTKQLYGHLIRNHILPTAIRRRRLDQLRPSHIDAFALEQGRRGKQRPSPSRSASDPQGMSEATVQRVFYVLRLVLDVAVRDGLITKNPAAVIKPPAVSRHEARFMSTATPTSASAETSTVRSAPRSPGQPWTRCPTTCSSRHARTLTSAIANRLHGLPPEWMPIQPPEPHGRRPQGTPPRRATTFRP